MYIQCEEFGAQKGSVIIMSYFKTRIITGVYPFGLWSNSIQFTFLFFSEFVCVELNTHHQNLYRSVPLYHNSSYLYDIYTASYDSIFENCLIIELKKKSFSSLSIHFMHNIHKWKKPQTCKYKVYPHYNIIALYFTRLQKCHIKL